MHFYPLVILESNIFGLIEIDSEADLHFFDSTIDSGLKYRANAPGLVADDAINKAFFI